VPTDLTPPPVVRWKPWPPTVFRRQILLAFLLSTPRRSAGTTGPQCVTAAIFWMKTRGGWRETPQSHEIAVTDVSQMTDEELIARIRILDQELAPYLELKANETGESDQPQPKPIS
jgi:hypothetical protein